jgi:hypothetical protein
MQSNGVRGFKQRTLVKRTGTSTQTDGIRNARIVGKNRKTVNFPNVALIVVLKWVVKRDEKSKETHKRTTKNDRALQF